MNLKLTRLSWNRDGWSRPSAVGKFAEGPVRGSKPTFVSKNNYGIEEWLFRVEHELDGWRYGFLMPSWALKPSQHADVIDAVLYTIAPDRTRFYLGRIDGVEILNLNQAIAARAEFEARGWLAEMADDLTALGLSTSSLNVPREESRDIVNVRFRPSAVKMLAEPLRAESGDVTHSPGRNQYRFYPLTVLPGALAGTPADPKQATGAYSYGTAPIVHADRIHNRIQERLLVLLRAKYGTGAASKEVNGVDIRLDVGPVITFIEVKSQGDARLAIREATGQLLEYALFARRAPVMPALVIAAPGALDSAAAAYLAELRTRFSLPLSYIQVDETTTVCPL